MGCHLIPVRVATNNKKTHQEIIIIKQTVVCACGALMHDSTISVEGNRFLFTGFQPLGAGAENTPAQSLVVSWDPAHPLLPTRPRSSPYPYLFLSWLCKQISILFGKYPCRFQSCHPLAATLLQDLEYIVLNLHVIVQENMCHVTLNHGGVQERTCPRRVTSP